MVKLQKQKATLKRLRNTNASNAARQQLRTAQLQSSSQLKSTTVLSVREHAPSVPKKALIPKASPSIFPVRVPISSTIPKSSQPQAPLLAVRETYDKNSRKYKLLVRKPRTTFTTVRILPRRRLPKFQASHALLAKGIKTLRQTLEKDVVFISLDTEFERRGLLQHVVEIGISILKTRDIVGLEPGPHGQNWFELLDHHHIVVDTTRSPRERMSTSRFGRSQFLSASEARFALVEILQSLASTAADNNTKLVFVGHSFESDLAALVRCPNLSTDLIELCTSGIPGLQVEAIFDTHQLSGDAQQLGFYLPSRKLGLMARNLGVDPVHFDDKNSLIGTHNAVNDAAYTLFATLLMAVNWDVYPRDKVALLSAKQTGGTNEKKELSKKKSRAKWQILPGQDVSNKSWRAWLGLVARRTWESLFRWWPRSRNK